MKRLLFMFLYLGIFYVSQAQVKVGDNPTVIHPSSLLELESANKGVLFPRVALTGANTAAPLSAFVAGMTVYNTATAGTGANAVVPGLYYCDGSKWVPTAKEYVEDPTLGSVAVFPFNALPTGYLACNGAAVSRTTYAALFAKIGTTYGAGDGSTTFNLPDLRGEFIRGWDNGRGVDAGRALATFQSGATQLPTTAFSGSTSSTRAPIYAEYGTNASLVYNVPNQYNQLSTLTSYGARTEYSAPHTHTVTITGGGDAETRPRNVAMVYAIKAAESAVVPTATSTAISQAAAANEPWYKVGTTSGATANTDNVYISGNVGIGLNMPAQKLDVGGNLALRNSAVNGGTKNISIQSTLGLNRWAIGMESQESGSGNNGGDFKLWSYADDGSYLSNPLTIIRATGNVGIGTNSPNKKLEVNSGTGNASGLRFTQLTATSPKVSGSVAQLGVNANGDVVSLGPVQSTNTMSLKTYGINSNTPDSTTITVGNLSFRLNITSSAAGNQQPLQVKSNTGSSNSGVWHSTVYAQQSTSAILLNAAQTIGTGWTTASQANLDCVQDGSSTLMFSSYTDGSIYRISFMIADGDGMGFGAQCYLLVERIK